MAKINANYEALYILDPALGEEEITALVEKFKGVVEANGSISAWQKMADDSPLLPLLVDQEVYPENLAQLGRNEVWLDTDLARRGMRRAEVLAYLGNKESCVVIQKKTAQNGRSEKPESTGGF